MPRVVPSQVISFIDVISSRQTGQHGYVTMSSIGFGGLSAVLDLVEQIPDELLTMDKEAYGSLILAKATIREILGTWTSNQNAGHKLLDFQFQRSNDPLAHIRKALAQCPDESPAPSTSELAFIPDADLRTNVRNDIGAVNRALSNGEWKAATILTGSVIEALLLWDLQSNHAASLPAR